MNTNKQKIILCTFGFVAAFVAIMVVLPFNILFEKIKINVDDIKGIELSFKFIIFPLIILFLSLFVLKLRNDNMKSNFSNTSLIKMSYVPVTMYTSGMLAWIGGVVAYGSKTYYNNTSALLIMVIVWSFSVIITMFFGVYTKWIQKMSYEQIRIIDIVYYSLSFIIMVLSSAIFSKYNEEVEQYEYGVFFEILVYVIIFFIIMLFAWKDIFSEEKVYIVSSKYKDENKIYEEAVKEVKNDFNNYNITKKKEEQTNEGV